MLRKFSLALIAMLSLYATTQAQVGQGALKGKVVDANTGEPLPFANIILESGGIQAGGATSDFEGNYTIKPISPGTYTLKATFVGYGEINVTDVKITGDKTTYYDVKMTEGISLGPVDVVFHQGLIDKDNMTTGTRVSREDIERLPVRSIGEIQGISAGFVGGSIRGSRGGASQTFIDGIRVRGSTNLPRAAIEEVNVITGGIPAEYGDLTGGVTSITTRGPSPFSYAAVELVSSGFRKNDNDEVFGLDNEGYNLVGVTYGGPLLFKRDEEGKKTKPLMAILFSSEYVSSVDPRPSIVGNYKVKDDVLAELQANPLRESGTGSGSVNNSSFLRMNDLEKIDTRRNVGRNDINLQANIDVNTTETTVLKFGGTFTRSDVNFDIRNNNPGEAFSLLNYENNPNQVSTTWRVFGRFTQRFNEAADEETKESAVIKNAFVSFQVDYTQVSTTTQNEKHEDRFFDYGYVGKFTPTRITDEIGNYALRSDTTADGQRFFGYFYEGPNQTELNFERGDKNPILANYTANYYKLYVDTAGNLIYPENYDREESVRTGGGLLNGATPRNVYDLWTDVGYQYDGYGVANSSSFRVTGTGSADIGKHHAIKLGFEYEQRNDRFYNLSPVGLWTLGRRLVNTHVQQLDRSNYTVDYRFGGNYPVITFAQLYDEASQSNFDRELRESLGYAVDGTQFIDLDSYDPSQLNIDMFSADELLNGGSPLVSYSGYDHTGDKLKGTRPSIDDFFNKRDENGNLTREVPSFQPIYVAGYIEDRFDFDDLVFRIGVRVDRFDANQPVLKDAFSLFPTVKAGNTITGGAHPSNIKDDFVVYVSDRANPSPDNIIGYRDPNGDDPDIWYNALGQEVASPAELGSADVLAPWLVDPSDETAEEDLTSASFEDYKPQVNVMPRISFSFPISEQANFYANYDVLTQRPATNLQMNPVDYLFLGTRNVVINNPNLKPVKTITYELGFEQLLTKNSSISYSAFYRESRDDIQVVRRLGAFPVPYRTFENIDFGTVKGLSVEYDLRRVKNIRVLANYTLQFAEGTGSSSTSQLNLINTNNPNLRTIQPLSGVDRRHTINITPEYRFTSGKEYNGPVVNGKDILENSGISFIMSASSGAPYSKSSVITSGGLFSGGQSRRLEGGINGSRYPWNFNIDMRVDKDFNVRLSKGSADKDKYGRLNVYVQVLNLLNTRNVFGVYDGTGSPEDDGYLSDAVSQPNIENQNDPQSFRDLYTAKILQDGFYSIQRRIRLGLQLNF
jgi:hypothetical protein